MPIDAVTIVEAVIMAVEDIRCRVDTVLTSIPVTDSVTRTGPCHRSFSKDAKAITAMTTTTGARGGAITE
jgi:hypothetical protein